jgi:hypothetical protein
VEQGILWITGNPDPEDTLLSAGDTMELVGPGMFVAQALNATTVRVWR